MDNISTSVAGQVPTTQCAETAADPRQLERMKPIAGTITWIPIASTLPPPPEDAYLAYWNPCDGMHFGYWDEDEGFMTGHPFTRTHFNGKGVGQDAEPIGEECSSFTHYAVLRGPADPDHDINHNWRLYSAGYKPPQEIRWEKADRLEEATGCTGIDALKALSAANGDEHIALAALKAGGAK